MKTAFGRSLNDFLPLSDAENRLVHACASGVGLTLSNELPEQKTPENSLRAELVRFLALGGDDSAPIHEMGVQVEGAWIAGSLNLDHCTVSRIWLGKCHFEKTLEVRNAQFQGGLHLNGSSIPGVKGDGLICQGSIFFRSGVIRDKAFEIRSSTIYGGLEFSGARFLDKQSDAISLDRSKVHGGIFFDENFEALGKVSLSSVFVGGSLHLSNARIESADESIDCLLDLKGSEIAVAFIFQKMLVPVDGVNLEGARIKYLADDFSSWGDDINFGSFYFDFFEGAGLKVSASERSEWLQKQRSISSSDQCQFNERPWKNVVDALVRSGLSERAVQVGMDFESFKYFGKNRSLAPHVSRCFERSLKALLGFFSCVLIGYGYKPWRLLGWFVFFWFAGGCLYWCAALDRSILPSSPLVYLNKELVRDCGDTWVLCKSLPDSHSAFSPFVYSLDVLLPVVDLDQEKNWTMKTPGMKEKFLDEIFSNWSFGHLLRFMYWFQVIFGWGSGLIFVAIITGLLKRQEK
jgi:hypothetical protein